MSDRDRLAPLAAALHSYTCSGKHTPDEEPKPPWCHKVADTILGERGVFLPDGDCGHAVTPDGQPVEMMPLDGDSIHRLLNDLGHFDNQCPLPEVATLRAALELAHDHHSFGPRDCTPTNCSAEAVLAEYRPHPDRRTEW